MTTILGLILAALGAGAVATGGSSGGGGDSDPADPVEEPKTTSRTPTATAEEPRRIVEEVEEEDEPPVVADEDVGVEDEKALTDALDLPDSAYELGWEGLTAQEQYMLELVNRARMDPETEEDRTGEAVDSGVSSTPKQALAVDPILSAAADNHSEDMLERDFFAHTNPDGENPTARAQDEGWESGGVWENISARWTSAQSVSDEQGWVDASHEGLWESDGHQFGMLQASHTVVGMGIDWGEWSYPGPTFPTAMVVTEKFANDGQTYLTGVVFDDADNDDFYDIGEGQGDVQITAWNDEEIHTTSTWDAGGYSLALETGIYNVRFEGGDLNQTYETTVTIDRQNEKLDVNEDDLGIAVLAMAPEDSTVEEDDPFADLFLSVEASIEVIEREIHSAEASEEPESEDEWLMI